MNSVVVCALALMVVQLAGCNAEQKAPGESSARASAEESSEPPEALAKLKAELEEEVKALEIQNLRCANSACNMATLPRAEKARVRLHEAVLKQLPAKARPGLVEEEAKWVVARDAAFAELPVVDGSPIAELNASKRAELAVDRIRLLFDWLRDGRRPAS